MQVSLSSKSGLKKETLANTPVTFFEYSLIRISKDIYFLCNMSIFSEPVFEWIKRWLKKPTNTTKQNLPPFSPTGDINDAPFPMPEHFMRYLNVHYQSFSLTQSSSTKLQYAFESDIIPRPIEQPFTRILFCPIPADKERTYGKCSPKLEMLDNLSETSRNRYDIDNSQPQKTTRLPLLSPKILLINENALQKYRRLKNSKTSEKLQEESDQKRVKKVYKRPARKALNVYLKRFAEQMNKNAIEFEKFCSTPSSHKSAEKKQ